VIYTKIAHNRLLENSRRFGVNGGTWLRGN